MAMQVRWTDNANRTLEHIFTCSQDFYSRGTLVKLNESLKNAEALLKDNPNIGGLEPLAEGLELDYRRIILNTPFKLIYFVLNDCVFIADIWDTRRSPENLTKNLD